jgi:hypothetical protein
MVRQFDGRRSQVLPTLEPRIFRRRRIDASFWPHAKSRSHKIRKLHKSGELSSARSRKVLEFLHPRSAYSSCQLTQTLSSRSCSRARQTACRKSALDLSFTTPSSTARPINMAAFLLMSRHLVRPVVRLGDVTCCSGTLRFPFTASIRSLYLHVLGRDQCVHRTGTSLPRPPSLE